MVKESPTRLLSRYQQLIEISRDLASTFELNTLLRRITLVSAQISRAETAILLLWDDSKKQLLFEQTTNDKDTAKLKGLVFPDKSLAGWVAQNRETLVIAEVKQDKRFSDLFDKYTGFSTTSMVAIPLIAKDHLVGVLEVFNKIGGPFSDYDKDTLQALGAQAAIAIENARLFQQADLIAELVHELRTPLASISTIAHLLQRQEVPEEQKLEMSQTIILETTRLNHLATSFLDLARMEARKSAFDITKCNLNDLISECYQIIQPKAGERNITVSLELSEEIPVIEADRDKIKQVILNLLTNAIKYNVEEGQIQIRTSLRWDEIIINIQDTGIGISSEEISLLFQRFFRAKSSEKTIRGTGLGLYVSKKIIENHGGKIEVQSQVGSGTTFTVILKSPITFNPADQQ